MLEEVKRENPYEIQQNPWMRPKSDPVQKIDPCSEMKFISNLPMQEFRVLGESEPIMIPNPTVMGTIRFKKEVNLARS